METWWGFLVFNINTWSLSENYGVMEIKYLPNLTLIKDEIYGEQTLRIFSVQPLLIGQTNLVFYHKFAKR